MGPSITMDLDKMLLQEEAAQFDQQLFELFGRINALPENCQKSLGQLIIHFANRIKELQYYQFNLKSAGAERLMLYLKCQALWPDIAENPHLSKAFKTCILMDELGQSALCFKLVPTLKLVELYLELCQKKQVPPSPDQIETIVIGSLMKATGDGKATLHAVPKQA